MKAWIGIKIRSNNKGLLNAVENALPHRLDNRLWDSNEYIVQRSFELDEIEIINVSLFFNDFNERANFKAALGAINGFIKAALPGSFIKTSKCWHDELGENDCPIKTDEIETEEVVD